MVPTTSTRFQQVRFELERSCCMLRNAAFCSDLGAVSHESDATLRASADKTRTRSLWIRSGPLWSIISCFRAAAGVLSTGGRWKLCYCAAGSLGAGKGFPATVTGSLTASSDSTWPAPQRCRVMCGFLSVALQGIAPASLTLERWLAPCK